MNTEEQLKIVNKEIEEKTYQRNLINNVENELNSLNSSVKECINLISSSIKGKNITEIVNNLTEENVKLTHQCNNIILEDKQKVNSNLNELNNNQILLQEKLREEEKENKEEI